MRWTNLPETPGSPCHWCDLINENKMVFDRDSLCPDCENCLDRMRYCVYTERRGKYDNAAPGADSFDVTNTVWPLDYIDNFRVGDLKLGGGG